MEAVGNCHCRDSGPICSFVCLCGRSGTFPQNSERFSLSKWNLRNMFQSLLKFSENLVLGNVWWKSIRNIFSCRHCFGKGIAISQIYLSATNDISFLKNKSRKFRYGFVVCFTACCIKTPPLASKLFRELQGRIFVGFWIGTRRWKALTPNFKMARTPK